MHRTHKPFTSPNVLPLVVFCLFSSLSLFAQEVKSSIDSTSVKIGQQITYRVEVETDSTDYVVFPEGQTFMPLEMIESFKIDTTKQDARYKLIKRYGLTQFDSGHYTIPRQKITIGSKELFTDPVKVEIREVAIDTTKQGLYDVKPMIAVDKPMGNWWKYLLIALLVFSVIGGLLYWFLWRKKPLTEEEEIALLPPYDRAKLALKKLDESGYLERSELKNYYSELTLAIRTYLDEKVYDHALESTTEELIGRLNLLREGHKIELSTETIRNLEAILKRADLVKFAKSEVDLELAKLDKETIDSEIDHVREVLPEPTEEEKLQDKTYKEEQERKHKRKKIIITSVVVVLIALMTFTGFAIKYGAGYVKDTILGHDTKELLEGDWVTSEYGIPPIKISTPKVLKRVEMSLPEEFKDKVKTTTFSYGSMLDFFGVTVSTARYDFSKDQQQTEEKDKPTIDLRQASEAAIRELEAQGVSNLMVMQEKYSTTNGIDGLKTYGTASLPIPNSDNFVEGEYIILQFAGENVLQQLTMYRKKDDAYAEKIIDRILNSIELKTREE
ncbi:BatD family protein [Mangrovimonas aestuarii]|uniref:BatD family protein n=1 Tax=Mangrovimonas aestuarii TaxID=3018443 RepID=UPI00387323F7